MNSSNYLVAGCKPWCRRVFDERIRHFPGNWRYVETADQLNADRLREWSPRYVFFLHWSWKVAAEVYNTYECVGFHASDLPYGRGGSPIQNLIQRGRRSTTLTALRMVEQLDAGPVYMKAPLCLEGSAEEIYLRLNELAAGMIRELIEQTPVPTPQQGHAEPFRRRTPAESEIGDCDSLTRLHDFLRMLDADGYPRAFLRHRGFRFEFSRAVRYDGRIVADVTITAEEPGS